MKKILILSLLLFSFAVQAKESSVELHNQMLDEQIDKLMAERDEKYKMLKKCEENTEGFKIAGITTLAATGLGVYGNIKLYQKYHGDESSSTSDNSEKNVPPPPPAEQNLNDLCKWFPQEC